MSTEYIIGVIVGFALGLGWGYYFGKKAINKGG